MSPSPFLLQLVYRCTALAAAFFGFCLVGFAAKEKDTNYPPPPFYPPKEHPRVYFMAKDLPRLRENTTKPQNAKAWAQHQKNVAQGTDGLLPPPKDGKGSNTDSVVLAVIESMAYDYALFGKEETGRKAVLAMSNYLRSVVFPPSDYNNAGQTLYTVGAVYDWCYPLLSQDDKVYLHQQALDAATHMEIGWPPVKQGNITGHGPEGQLLRDIMCMAIAMHDEHPELYKIAAGRFFSKMVESKFFMYPAHSHHQGCHYANYRGQWEMLCTWIFDRMGLPKVFGPDQQYLMYWSLYARRGDGQILRDGDQHINNEEPYSYFKSPGRTMFLESNYFKDPYLKTEALNCVPDFTPMKPSGNQALNSTEMLVFNDPDLAPRPLSELPLTHYFPYPKGAMIARSSWEPGIKSPAVVAEFKINEWNWANHQHLDHGGFQLYYRGILANDSGYYQAGVNKVDKGENDGNSGYGSLYDVNYDKRSIAHNVMTVYDPEEIFDSVRWKKFKIANDGGQRFPNRWIEPQEHEDFIDPKADYHVAKVLGQGFGPDAMAPDYSYLKGDLTRTYSNKIKAYERSFVFLNLKQVDHPAALIVFDRVVSSKAGFRKAWLLHGLEEPSIQGNQSVFKVTRPHYTGKLTVDTLLPEAGNTVITPVGGPGKEFLVDGTNYLCLLRPDKINEGGGWRIEVSPKLPAETDFFLNVLQPGDHTPDTAPLPTQKIETEARAGLRLADRVVLFAKARDRVSEPVSFSFSGAGECQILVADLSAGSWSITRDAKPLGKVSVSEQDGLALFRGEAGTYVLTKN
jgi:hypothetical protein